MCAETQTSEGHSKPGKSDSVAEGKEVIGEGPAGEVVRGPVMEAFICRARSLDFVLRTAWEALESFKESQVWAASLCRGKDTMKQREGRCREELFYGWSFPWCF